MESAPLTVESAVNQILTLAADQLSRRTSTSHCVSIGLVRDAIAAASDTLLRRNPCAGSSIDAARIKVYGLLPPTAGTTAEYAAGLRSAAEAERACDNDQRAEADDPEGEDAHEECFGIHNSADGYRDCDGNLI